MGATKEAVAKLANAWLAEAKRLRSRALCDCGCGEGVSVARARFKPGHDAKLLRDYKARIYAILESK